MISNTISKEHHQMQFGTNGSGMMIQFTNDLKDKISQVQSASTGTNAWNSFLRDLNALLSSTPSTGRNGGLLARAKNLANSAVKVATSSNQLETSIALECMAQLILSPGSRQFHRPILSVMKNMPTELLEDWHRKVNGELRESITGTCSNPKTYCNTTAWIQAATSILEFPAHVPAVENLFSSMIKGIASVFSVSSINNISFDTENHKPTCNSDDIANGESVKERPSIQHTELLQITDCISLLYSILHKYSNTLMTAFPEEIDFYESKEGQGKAKKKDLEKPLQDVHVNQICSFLLSLMQHKEVLKETLCSAAAVICLCWSLPHGRWHIVSNYFTETLAPSSFKPVLSSKDTRESIIKVDLFGEEIMKKNEIISALRQLPDISLLCMLRGLLQTIPIQSLITSSIQISDGRQWSLLLDGIMSKLCNLTTGVHESQLRYQALQTLVICLDRLSHQFCESNERKESEPCYSSNRSIGDKQHESIENLVTQSRKKMGQLEEEFLFLSPSMQQKILEVLWSNWVDPSPKMVKLSQICFSNLLKVVEAQAEIVQGTGGHVSQDFLETIAKDLLMQEPTRKGRYGPLTIIIPRIGATKILQLQPKFVEESLKAMAFSRSLCGAIGSALGLFWSTMKMECDECSCSDQGQRLWQAAWAPDFIHGMCSEDQNLRRAIYLYALPALISVDKSVVDILLAEVAKMPKYISTPSCIAILTAARESQAISSLNEVSGIYAILNDAVMNENESVRSDALQLICNHPRSLALPSKDDLRIVDLCINLTLRCTSASARQRLLADVGHLLARIRVGCGAILSRPKEFSEDERLEVEMSEAWLRKFCGKIVASLYPDAQYGRKFLALELLCTMLDMFGKQLEFLEDTESEGIVTSRYNDCGNKKYHISESVVVKPRRQIPICLSSKSSALRKSKSTNVGSAPELPASFQPFYQGFISKELTRLLLGAIQDPWDRIREAAAECLLRLPAPLPGLDTVHSGREVLRDALVLVHSPRMKDADAGARLVVVIFGHYVLGMGWQVRITERRDACSADMNDEVIKDECSTITLIDDKHACNNTVLLCLEYLDSIIGVIQEDFSRGHRNLELAARYSLAHGSLLALRYLLPVFPWSMVLNSNTEIWNTACLCSKKIIEALLNLSNLIIPILSTPEEMTAVGAADVELEDIVSSQMMNEEPQDNRTGPLAQLITCACWMTAKEVALLLGTFFQVAPVCERIYDSQPSRDKYNSLLSAKDQEAAGMQLFRMLLEGKHNGAIDKTQTGFIALCSALLASSNCMIAELPRKWLREVLEYLQRPNQSLRDIVRRSAGLPFAITGLFKARAGTSCAPSGLTDLGMADLLQVAGDKTSIEPWPRVHAFNCLRMAFSDNEISNDTSKFYASGIQVSIQGLRASEWEIRNAATLCYTALLVRIIGFANLSSQEKVGKCPPTAREFFNLYPSLRPFILQEISSVANEIDHKDSDTWQSNPSIGPVMALLFRLRPEISTGLQGPLATSVENVTESINYQDFVGVLQKCASSSSMPVRQRAAKALPAFVSVNNYVKICEELSFRISEEVKSWKGHVSESRLHGTDTNRIHGHFLQLENLLFVLKGKVSVDVKTILDRISQNLQDCISLCFPIHGTCATIAYSMLKLAEISARIGIMYEVPEALDFVVKAAHHGWNAVLDTVGPFPGEIVLDWCCTRNSNDSFALPMRPLALKQAVALRMVWAPLYHHSVLFSTEQDKYGNADKDLDSISLTSDFVDVCCSALSSSCYEVRCAVWKSVVNILQTPKGIPRKLALSFQQHMFSEKEIVELCFVLDVHISMEVNKKCLKRSLKTLSVILLEHASLVESDFGARMNAALPGSKNLSWAGSLFNKLLVLAVDTTDEDIKSFALLCLGSLLHLSGGIITVVENSVDGNNIVEDTFRIRDFVDLLLDCSNPAQSVVLREAAAKSISSSYLLSVENDIIDKISKSKTFDYFDALKTRVWTLAVMLLEDEDEHVRSIIASAVSDSLQMNPMKSHLWSEVVIRRLLIALSKLKPESAPFLSALLNWTCQVELDKSSAFCYLNSARSDEPKVNTEKLFERESDNHFEEPLLLSQVAAKSIVSVITELVSIKKGHSSKEENILQQNHTNMCISSMVGKVVNWGASAARSLLEITETQSLAAIKSATNLEKALKAFPSIARLLLALSTTLRCIIILNEGDQVAEAEVIKDIGTYVRRIYRSMEFLEQVEVFKTAHVQITVQTIVQLWQQVVATSSGVVQEDLDTIPCLSTQDQQPWHPDSFLVDF